LLNDSDSQQVLMRCGGQMLRDGGELVISDPGLEAVKTVYAWLPLLGGGCGASTMKSEGDLLSVASSPENGPTPQRADVGPHYSSVGNQAVG
jgi:hypothetical protein